MPLKARDTPKSTKHPEEHAMPARSMREYLTFCIDKFLFSRSGLPSLHAVHGRDGDLRERDAPVHDGPLHSAPARLRLCALLRRSTRHAIGSGGSCAALEVPERLDADLRAAAGKL